MLFGGGRWDFGLPNANTVNALDATTFTENAVVSGAHDFNAWNQLFTLWARDYLWKPYAHMADKLAGLQSAVGTTGLDRREKRDLDTLLRKADQALSRDKEAHTVELLQDYVDAVNTYRANEQLTAAQATALLTNAQRIISNLNYWS
jgi:hypothetical protein